MTRVVQIARVRRRCRRAVTCTTNGHASKTPTRTVAVLRRSTVISAATAGIATMATALTILIYVNITATVTTNQLSIAAPQTASIAAGIITAGITTTT